MKRGITIDPTGRRVLIAEDFSCFLPFFGDANAPQDWYTSPLTADPWGQNTWDLAIGGQGWPPPPNSQGPITMYLLKIGAWQ